MTDFILEAQSRSTVGTSKSRALRKSGLVPSIVYSRGESGKKILVRDRDFVALATKARPTQVFTIKSEDKDLDGTQALVQDIQQEAKTGKVLHVDFLELHAGEEVIISVPLSVVGEADGVKNQGGILEIHLRELTITCLPKNIPQEIVVDVSHLSLGERIQAKDIELPEGVSLRGEGTETAVNVVVGRAAKLAASEAKQAAGEGEAAEEGEEKAEE